MTARRRILLAEDEVAIAEAVEARLSAEGYAVACVADGLSAVEAARKDPPDLILLDVMMPKVGGLEVCRILKADPKTAAIPIVMVTALSQMKDAEKAFEFGANDYLPKPFEFDRLLYKIRKFV